MYVFEFLDLTPKVEGLSKDRESANEYGWRLIQSFVNDKRTVHLEGPAGLECSPDGRFIYVPLEKQKGISIYKRELSR